MSTEIALILVAVIVVAAFLIKKNSKIEDINIPEPTTKRNNIKFGYYAAFGDQANEVKDHTNLYWESRFFSPEQVIQNIKTANMDTVLDVARELFEKIDGKLVPTVDARERLKNLFDSFKTAGILQNIKVLYPMDEPDVNGVEEYMPERVALLKEVASNYEELTGVKIGVILYGKRMPYKNTECFDIIGLDWYDKKSTILADGSCYDILRQQLSPGQQLILVPGGAYGQDPMPFVNYAHLHEDVYAVVPFLWSSFDDGKNSATGIRDNNLRDIYIRVGKDLTGK